MDACDYGTGMGRGEVSEQVCVCVYEDELLVCVTVKIIIVHRSRFI